MTFYELALAIFLALSLDRYIALAVNVILANRARKQIYQDVEQMINGKQELMAAKDLASMKGLRIH